MDILEGKDGRWWAVCLAVRPQQGKQSQLGRETFLMPLEWVDDWPVANEKQQIGIAGPASAKLSRVPREQEWKADFKPNMGMPLRDVSG